MCMPAPPAATSGASGTYVERIQTRLYYLGYFSKASSIDGSFGSTTVAAVKLFQAQHGLDDDGIAGQKTLEMLIPKGGQS